MKRTAILLSLLLPLSVNAYAASSEGYMGVFGGAMMADGLETNKADPRIVTLGRKLNSRVAVQLEYSDAESFKTRVSDASGSETPCDAEFTSTAAYVVLTQPAGGLIDISLKLGYVDIDYDFDADLSREQRERYSDQSRSIGGGVTLKVSKDMVLKTEYTQLKDNVYYLTAGVELSL